VSSIHIKTPEELQIMREGGKILAEIVTILKAEVVEGNTSIEVDRYAELLCKRFNVKPAFKGYHDFPYTICSNLNEVVVHGYANSKKIKSGDIFGLDMGIIYHGFYLDMSVTVEVGKVAPEVHEFVQKTYDSMMQGIEAAKTGNHIGDISVAMGRNLLSPKFSLMRDFVGHGIGRNLHETPNIPGIGMKPGQGPLVEPGMVFAIESISVMGPTNAYEVDKDGWTVYTKNRQYLSGLWEHTVIVTENGPEIITIFN
jgi:methionyl aminopeptidase